MTTTAPLPAAGWYPDPANPAGRRYWDGHAWAAPQVGPRPEFVMVRPGQPLWADQTPKRRRFKVGRTLGLLVIVLVLIAAGTLAAVAASVGAQEARDTLAKPQPGAAGSTAPSQPAPQPAAPTGIGPGTHVVGTDIAPGTYRTAGPVADDVMPNCYWAREKDTSGSLDAIIANNNTEGPATVTIAATDGPFETTGCQDWVRVR